MRERGEEISSRLITARAAATEASSDYRNSRFREPLARLLGGPWETRVAQGLSKKYLEGKIGRDEIDVLITALGETGTFDEELLRDEFERVTKEEARRL